MPVWLQHWLRDSGAVRLGMDTLTRLVAAPNFYRAYPSCLPEFLRLSGFPLWMGRVVRTLLQIPPMESSSSDPVTLQSVRYGEHPSQFADVLETDDNPTRKTLVFVHGGAWGSGFPTMYRLLALPFLKDGYRVVILGYRVYPAADIEAQIEDICAGMTATTSEAASTTILAHSSGSHLTILAALRGKLPKVRGIIGMSGVYNLEQHYAYEKTRGIHEISPMRAVCQGDWTRVSPSHILTPNMTLPPTILIHGLDDTIVDPRESIELHRNLQHVGITTDLEVADGLGHAEAVIEACVGGSTQDLIQNWLKQFDSFVGSKHKVEENRSICMQ